MCAIGCNKLLMWNERRLKRVSCAEPRKGERSGFIRQHFIVHFHMMLNEPCCQSQSTKKGKIHTIYYLISYDFASPSRLFSYPNAHLQWLPQFEANASTTPNLATDQMRLFFDELSPARKARAKRMLANWDPWTCPCTSGLCPANIGYVEQSLHHDKKYQIMMNLEAVKHSSTEPSERQPLRSDVKCVRQCSQGHFKADATAHDQHPFSPGDWAWESLHSVAAARDRS